MQNEQGPMPVMEQASFGAATKEFIARNWKRLGIMSAIAMYGLAGIAAAGDYAPAVNDAPAEEQGTPCDDPAMDVCAPDVTAPEDAESVPGNPEAGDTIPQDEEFDKKGTTTVPASTTTVPASTTTVPASTTTVPASTTTVPASTTTVPAPAELVEKCEVGDFDQDGDKDYRIVTLAPEDVITGIHYDQGSPECEDIEPPVVTVVQPNVVSHTS